MIRVMIVDDSPVVTDLLTFILESDPKIKIVATAKDGYQAIEMALNTHPDVITMDIYMPVMDGVEAIAKIMSTNPIPTVIVSTNVDPKETGEAFRALQAGAIAVCAKPQGPTHPLFDVQSRAIVQTVKMASEVKVVHRWEPMNRAHHLHAKTKEAFSTREDTIQIVAIGASTGGPPVLCEILSGLKKNFSAPILIVQHIAPGFLPGMVGWLKSSSGVSVEIASEKIKLRPGHVYLAPDGFHMEALKPACIHLTRNAAENGMRPAISVLFRSVAANFDRSAIGILLTGMGKDGAAELLEMRNNGALTIVQDKKSSVVTGMPAETDKLGAAQYVLPPAKITEMLNGRIGEME
ncbi:MAG: chemotaxis-specific protein-glutamate methyltransferase CheB [Treponemataceae bacterium]